uniref:Uncharacterized protein n=1 Tax=Tanacetum cinerariifolium TaxID=118510 RepID=A0A699HM22_TANCI|nr:hypothetical protein [Tanacetum cinerariifolium]
MIFDDKQLDGMPTHKENYDVSFHTKKVFANMKRIGTGFSGKETPLFPTMVGPNQIQMGEGSAQPTNTKHTPNFDMPPPNPKRLKDLSNPRERPLRATTAASSLEAEQDSGVNTPQSYEDRLKHIELMKIYTTFQKEFLDMENELKRTKTAQQTKIDGLERRVKKLEKQHRSRTHKLKRLYKVGLTDRVISSSDDEALDKEDTSKQRRIDKIVADKDIALVSTHDNVIQDEGIKDVGEEEVVEVVTTAKMIIDVVGDAAHVTTAIADIPVSAAETIVTTTPTNTAESIKINVEVTQPPKRKGVMIQESEEATTTKTSSSQQPQVQDKGKGKAKLIEEPKMPKKRKHQIRVDEKLAKKLQAGMKAQINEEDRIARES